MSEYWKSTPSYWCKFCSQYVRDTTIERKNHEASAKHQNNIQRSLRELHKNKEREDRDKQRAKDEVARLNGMFDGAGGKKASGTGTAVAPVGKSATMHAPVPTAASRRAQAEQLAAMGVELPEELKREVTGVGSYQVVNAREAESEEVVTVNRSLAEILAEARGADKNEDGPVKAEEKEEDDSASKHAQKRKAEDDDDIRDEEAAPKRKAWGSNLKTYPGDRAEVEDTRDLDALLSGVKKKEPKAEAVKTEVQEGVKQEEDSEAKPLGAVPEAPSAVVFKKRKGKR